MIVPLFFLSHALVNEKHGFLALDGSSVEKSLSSQNPKQGTPDATGSALSAEGEKVLSKVGADEEISVTMKAVLFLTVQFFFVFTALQIVKTINDFTGDSLKEAGKVLEKATSTVTFAPMLAIFFIGVRMRALQLTNDQGNPAMWVRTCMMGAASTLLAQTLMVIIEGLTDTSGVSMIFTGLKNVAILALYSFTLAVCYGVVTDSVDMKVFLDIPVSPALMMTIFLSVQFFIVYALWELFKTLEHYKVAMMDKWAHIFSYASKTVTFAPMLSVLFIATRMRAIQLDPTTSELPEAWTQQLFSVCGFSILAQTILVVLLPLLAGAKMEEGKTEGDVTFVVENKMIGGVVEIARYLLMLAVYGSATGILYALFLMKAPSGTTPSVPPTMVCITILTGQFFIIYLALWIAITTQDIGGIELPQTIKTLKSTVSTVTFAPALAALFLAVRMRAEELSDNKGNPLCWAQEAMYASTFALALQCIMEILRGVLPTGAEKMWIMSICVEAVKYLVLLGLYGGLIVVGVSVFIMDSTNTVTPGQCIISNIQ